MQKENNCNANRNTINKLIVVATNKYRYKYIIHTQILVTDIVCV